MLILKIKDPKIEKMLGEILMRTSFSDPVEYFAYRVSRDGEAIRRGSVI